MRCDLSSHVSRLPQSYAPLICHGFLHYPALNSLNLTGIEMVLPRFGVMKKFCVFMCVITPCLYTVIYIICFQKANVLLKNGFNYDETKELQYNLIQREAQEVLRGREDAKELSNEDAKQGSFWKHFEIVQSNSSVILKTIATRPSKVEIPIKGPTVSKDILPASAITKDLIRGRPVKQQLIASITAAQATKIKLALRNQWMIWNEDSSSSNLNRRLQNVKNNYVAMNKYAVNFTGKRRLRKLSSKELLCELKQRVEVASIQFGDEPFTTSRWKQFLPTRNLSQALGPFQTCAVVASAGSILKSKLGREIDAHDAVLRFNRAPTIGFESDVGNRTTIRIVNSQWFKQPDYDFFENYIKYRENNPDQPLYIINPKMQWQLWNILQENAAEDIQRNPPSSGLMGILLMMTVCNEIDVYEFLPSQRQTDLCHYYEKFQDQACTLGAYHPLMFEKNMVKRINRGSDKNIYVQGKVTLPGFRTFQCPNSD
ncbi:beta-galactoside alpha-2,6-sialyltransferase 1 isoform X2 [Amblyraja radiata]|uniref:beta-galactoside alpha-2,6-sialyltransferase 1 isoform X2 n=1 Tax=Amblyraja radiata TaxID=386614 RepID=UPI0014040C3A|nr:beta-galactoside alpha-2,6-sialyltransferase 1 isoform X2 [Amblyraja radiata]